MVMSGKHDQSPAAIEDRRLDRNGWLFAIFTVTVSCTAILIAFSSIHPWH